MARKKLLSEGEVRQFMKLANLAPLSENYFSTNPLEEESEEEEELHATEDELGAEDHFADEEADELDAMDMEGGDDNEALLARVVQAVADELGVAAEIEGVGEEGGEEDLEADVEMDMDMGGDELEMDVEEELPGNMYQEGEGSKKGEYKRRDKDGKVGHRAGDVDHHYKDYEDDTGEKKGDESSTHPGRKDYQEGQELEEYATTGDPTGGTRQATRKGAVGGREKCYNAQGNRVACDGSEGEVAKRQAAEAVELDQDAIVAEVARRVAQRLSADKQKEELAEHLAERIFNRLTAK